MTAQDATTRDGSSWSDVKARIESVEVRFGQKLVHDRLSLDIPRGETTVIMGPSGCGKSVLLKLIVGLMRPDRGNVWVDGENVPRLKRRALNRLRQRMGMLFQSSALFDSMTVEENVAFMLRQHTRQSPAEMARAVSEALELVGLPGTHALKPAELSGGMRKRVGLARAIVMRPDLILYDEPTTGLDPITARGINRLIRDLHQRLGTTSIVVTHDVESALYVGSRIAMTVDGKIVLEGTPDEVRGSDVPLARQFFQESQLPASA
ncbi:ABC transporter ATP-binding protein [Candidatus Poribacteria bacterium]|nr:ABC transporter ATP-binding protein [Candidatus Poribacteria bacterium]